MGRSILLLVLIMGATFISETGSSSCIVTGKISINVVNEIPNSKMRLHCASKDDDLGYHILPYHGKLSWHFCLNLVRTTIFFCHLWVDHKQKAFDVINKELVSECNQTVCNWVAKDDGVYFSPDKQVPTRGLVKKYSWDPFN